MKTYTFTLNMPYAECQDLYAEQIRFVIVRAHTGEKLQLPKENLKRFLLPNGLVGHFELKVNAQNKIISLQKLHIL
ncbi:DUF2835 family protein [Glaciecola siphonariae]|uniref:DUF2835 family protein n=1 Tax=Glaciecola siphonariae TaxID=521012 RepID=A0ABV9LSI5_9ALTE